MAANYPQIVGVLLLLLLSSLVVGCAATRPPASQPSTPPPPPPMGTLQSGLAPAPVMATPPRAARAIGLAPGTNGSTSQATSTHSANASSGPTQGSTPQEQLAVLTVEAGALITQVNGDPKIRCTRPDCSIPLPPGTHRLTVGYRDTATRAGSTVTYASMYPRVIEITLKPGHRYSMTASGRHSEKWWIAIEDQTTNKVVYNDRPKPK